MKSARRVKAMFVSLTLFGALLGAQATGASAAEAASHLKLHVLASPSSYSSTDSAHCESPGYNHCDKLILTATNTGAAPTHGTTTLKAVLPPGLTKFEAYFARLTPAHESEQLEPPLGGATAACKTTGQAISCKSATSIAPDQALQLILSLNVSEGALSGEVMEVSMTSLETPEVALSVPTLLDSPAPFGITSFENAITGEDGLSFSTAGSHPYGFTIHYDFNSIFRHTPEGPLKSASVKDQRDVEVDLPPGLAGSAEAAPKCTELQIGTLDSCPADTRIGYVETQPQSIASINSPIYNMVPRHGVASEFAFTDVLNNPHFIYTEVVPSLNGYILRSSTPETPQIPLLSVNATFFGNPAARDKSTEPAPALLSLPSNCNGGALRTALHVDSWQSPGPTNADGTPDFTDPRWAPATSESPPVTGCKALRFHASLEAAPQTNRADSPTGLNVTLKVPQSEGAEELATPPLKKAVVTLPAGMSVNPSSANGLEGCSLAGIGISPSGQPNAAAPNCPDASKIGSVELLAPAVEGDPNLGGALQGQVYLAKQGENPFGTLLALYIVINDPYTGVIAKLPGEVRADPVTGQLTTVVDNNPQFPFSELRTHFFGGQRAALRTPPTCGTYKVESELTPYSAPESGPPATPSSSFQISTGANGEPCPSTDAARPNSPSFSAGTAAPIAAAYSPFLLRLARLDGSQEIGSLSVAMPPGLTGKLAGLSECSETALVSTTAKSGREELAHPSCPASSRLGSVQVGAGAGLEPFYATGQVYLAGPYKGAPLSLAIVTPAVAGPYDLGDVLVRNALRVDPETTRITAVSDPIPHILQGIPLDIRSISLDVGREQFILNPSNCERFGVAATETSTLGAPAALSNPFQVGGCAKLGFKPHLSLTLKGKVTRASTPRLIAKLTYPRGTYANVASAQVTLPPSAFLDNAHIQTICTRVQFSAGERLGEECPAKSIYGRAKAVTPLLDAPLTGPVYLRSSSHELPDLVVALNGQVPVALDGRTDSVKGALRNTFEAVPDAPVTSFEVELFGGKRGLIEMSSGFCKNPRAKIKFTGQNGKVQETSPKVGGRCPKPKRRKHRRSHSAKRG